MSASDRPESDRPDLAALRELEALIRTLGDEMATWRRRAQLAESRVRELEAAAQTARTEATVAPVDPRVVALEQENQALQDRLQLARQRTAQLLERMRFLRQQTAQGAQK